MSRELFSRNADLKRLREEGYFVQVVGGALVMRQVPYVDSQRQVRYGTLISSLTLAGDQTCRPDTHVMFFDGDFPCEADGSPMSQISHQNVANTFGNITARYSFSSKPEGGYLDYHHKMSTYASILAGPATVLQPGVTPKVNRMPDDEEESVFNYVETASDRVGIGALTQRFATHRVAIIGTGGTGSYVLDFVAKTPVREILLFDGDEFLTHNAFRAPGAPSIEDLRDAPRKVDYLKSIYSRMHRGISVRPALDASNLDLLQGVTFAFICIDPGEAKRLVVERLEAMARARALRVRGAAHPPAAGHIDAAREEGFRVQRRRNSEWRDDRGLALRRAPHCGALPGPRALRPRAHVSWQRLRVHPVRRRQAQVRGQRVRAAASEGDLHGAARALRVLIGGCAGELPRRDAVVDSAHERAVPAAIQETGAMRLQVVIDRDLCQGHGVCMGEAPDVFLVVERAGDYGQAQLLLDPFPEAMRTQVEAAVRYCPNRALKIVEEP